MKILHLGDLHLGKRVNEISMIEDQKFILDQIVTLVKEEKIDVILLWQYDRLSVPYSLAAKAGAWRKEMRLKRWRRK